MSRTDDGNDFADLSGATSSTSDNPYDTLIDACVNDPKEIQIRYHTHREARNEQQRTKLLASDFSGFMIDPVLEKLIDSDANPGYIDPRNCLVFWVRPPKRIRGFVGIIQAQLLELAPSLWLMPLDCLHMTVLEITHSREESEIDNLVSIMKDRIPEITDFSFDHRARLVKPLLSYDAAAIALSFVPAIGEASLQASNDAREAYTYHHLRRDVYELSKKTGIEIASRYTVPSSHLTIARFVSQKDIMKSDGVPGLDPAKMSRLVEGLEEINVQLKLQWEKGTGDWIVGEEKGLDYRKGRLWYGGGQTEHLGKGFFVV